MTKMVMKKKRVSKRSKLSWRKHVNINDVEEFLEDQRLEERLGPPLETLSDDALFKVDTKPSSEQVLSSKERKRLKLSKTPRCFALLEPHTKVPDPIVKRNRVRSKEERKNELIKKKEAENRAKGILKYSELQAIRDHQNNEKMKETRPKRGEFAQNIWENDDAFTGKNQWVSKSTIKHHLVGTGQGRKTVKDPKKSKASILPCIEAPHPGMSYNPSYSDHQDLLKAIAEKEMKVIKEEEHLNRVTKDMFCKVSEQKRDSMWLQEMSQGLQNPADNNENDDGEYKSVNPPTKNKKKTLQQRRKQREQMQADLLRKVAKVAKKKISDIHHLRILKKQIDTKEARAQVLQEKRKTVKLLKKKEPKRLSAIKFEETELDFNMGPDITGNLRNMKKEGNLLTDRFKSLQKRNLIEPSVRRHRKKGKVKVYTKPGHKEDWITTVARQ